MSRRLAKVLHGQPKHWTTYLRTIVSDYNFTFYRATKKKPFVVFRKKNVFNSCVADDESQDNVDHAAGENDPN